MRIEVKKVKICCNGCGRTEQYKFNLPRINLMDDYALREINNKLVNFLDKTTVDYVVKNIKLIKEKGFRFNAENYNELLQLFQKHYGDKELFTYFFLSEINKVIKKILQDLFKHEFTTIPLK